MPAPTSVEAWRVSRARSSDEMRWKEGRVKRRPLAVAATLAWAACSVNSVTKMPSRRSFARALRELSASRWPRVFFPAAVTPLYA